MIRRFSVLVILTTSLAILTGCAAATALPPTATPTVEIPPTAVTTPTPEIVWFPPTPTPTTRPTQEFTPTPELITGLGAIILTDTFEDGSAWSLGQTALGATSVLDGSLTIAIAEEKAYLYTVRWQPVLTDFYLSLTASPALCKGQDEYGVLLRVNEDLDYYRFSLSCDGQVRLDRIIGSTASSPKPWYYSGAFPPGSPVVNRLGVWMSGKEMRFFINDIYQFTINDPLITKGSIGLFARSTGGHALTVNFSDLILHAVDQP